MIRKSTPFFLLGLIVIITIITMQYIDKPLLQLMHRNNTKSIAFFDMLCYIPNAFIYFSTIVSIMLVCFRKHVNALTTRQRFLLFSTFSGLITVVCIKILKVFFGRIGPDVWIAHSFEIHNNGFHFLRGYLSKHQDFPSGHTAVIFSYMPYLYRLYEGYLLTITLTFLCTLVIFGLLATYSHFLSDIIVGAYIGYVIGKTFRSFFKCHRIKPK